MAPSNSNGGRLGAVRPAPATAHRLAAWLSLAVELAGTPAGKVRFPPTVDDIQALRMLWLHRLGELREAGVEALMTRHNYDKAMECQPHAFAYAGEGKPCRLPFCPFCNAADAAETYERVRRALERRRGEFGLLLGQATAAVGLDDLAREPLALLADTEHFDRDSLVSRLLRRAAPFGAIVKANAWPHESRPGRAVVVGRALAAVPAALAGKVASEHADDAYAVRLSPASLARAVAHLCRFPEMLLLGDAEKAAAVINRTAGKRRSVTRNPFRWAQSLAPESFPFVAMSRNEGVGVVGAALGVLAQADEALAAREASSIMRRPACDTFAALSEMVGVPLYWLGRVPLGVDNLAKPPKGSALGQAVKQFRPKIPAEKHALVFATPGAGLQLLSTWCPPPGPECPLLPQATYAFGVAVRGRRYALGGLADLARLALGDPGAPVPGATAADA